VNGVGREADVVERLVVAMRNRRAEDHWLVGGLRELGFHVTVVEAEARTPLKIGALDRRLSRVASLWLSWRGARLAARTGAVLIAHAYMVALLSAFVPLPRGTRRAPSVGLNMILVNDGSGLLPRRGLHRRVLRRPGVMVTVNSQQLADRYSTLLGVPSERFALLRDCCPQGAAVRRPTATGDFVFVGGKRRDLTTALAAARACPEVPFEIIARKSDWPRGLKAPPNARVRFDTPASVFYKALHECRFAVAPLWPGANLGLIVVIRGVLDGKPVVASRTPETEAYYPPECSHLLVPLSDSRSLATIVHRLWNDEHEVVNVAEDLQSHIQAQFPAWIYLAELADIIKKVRTEL
jgi:hypothetical protein